MNKVAIGIVKVHVENGCAVIGMNCVHIREIKSFLYSVRLLRRRRRKKFDK